MIACSPLSPFWQDVVFYGGIAVAFGFVALTMWAHWYTAKRREVVA